MIRSHNVQITPEILNLIAEVDEFKGAWRAFGPLAPDRLAALRRVATIERIGSSTRIGGQQAVGPGGRTPAVQPPDQSFATRDKQAVAGYAEVVDLVLSSWQNNTLTEYYMKQLHRNLLTYSEKDAWHHGNYKTAGACSCWSSPLAASSGDGSTACKARRISLPSAAFPK